jgi:hypothetical protein
MKTALHTLLAVALTFSAAGSFASQHVHAADAEKAAPAGVDAHSLLKQCAAAGVFPETMLIRLSACLGQPDADGPAMPPGLREEWEIDSKQVHRLAWNDEVRRFVRVESKPLATADLCGILLNGKAVEIQQRKGEGPTSVLVGSGYRKGSRMLTVFSQGNRIIDLHEGNGALPDYYARTDAVAFGQLYEMIASRAREAFKAQPAGAPKR